MSSLSWTIDGAAGQPIFGDTHLPDAGPPKGVVVVCHGFKGYKDYGFLPALAQAAADWGFIAHRFNFSHSGMTNRLETFERPDLFAKDTWGKQIHDLMTVAGADAGGRLPGNEAHHGALPVFWLGHSRGGVTVLLTAGRVFAGLAGGYAGPRPSGLITLAAPSGAQWLDESQRRVLRRQGYLESPSARTGQALRIGTEWLEEMEGDAAAFDVHSAIRKTSCPILIVHGEQDATVPVEAAYELVQAAGSKAQMRVIAGASHTFNAVNPMPPGSPPGLPPGLPPPPETREMIESVRGFLGGLV